MSYLNEIQITMKKKKLDLKKLKVDSFITDESKIKAGLQNIEDEPIDAGTIWTFCGCTGGCTDGCTRTSPIICLQTAWNCTYGGCTDDCVA